MGRLYAAEWKSEELSEVDHVHIDANDPNWPDDNIFYISIQAFFEAYFSIMVLVKDTYALLIDGFPMEFGLDHDMHLNFLVTKELAGGKVKCEITPEGPVPRVYVKFE